MPSPSSAGGRRSPTTTGRRPRLRVRIGQGLQHDLGTDPGRVAHGDRDARCRQASLAPRRAAARPRMSERARSSQASSPWAPDFVSTVWPSRMPPWSRSTGAAGHGSTTTRAECAPAHRRTRTRARRRRGRRRRTLVSPRSPPRAGRDGRRRPGPPGGARPPARGTATRTTSLPRSSSAAASSGLSRRLEDHERPALPGDLDLTTARPLEAAHGHQDARAIVSGASDRRRPGPPETVRADRDRAVGQGDQRRRHEDRGRRSVSPSQTTWRPEATASASSRSEPGAANLLQRDLHRVAGARRTGRTPGAASGCPAAGA